MNNFFENLPKSRQHLIALAVLFIVPLILFFDSTLGGKELQRHDITQWRAGAQSVIEYREQFGEEPLWVSNMFGGMPSFVVSTKTQVPHLDFLARLFKGIYPAFQYWVMLSGMYFLLILMGFRPFSAIFGAMTYGLSTYFPVIIMAGHTSKFFALALAPWVVAGYWKLTRSDNRIAGLLIFSVALALEFRAGHPQITYYFFFLLGFLWLYDTWKAYQAKTLKNWGVITALLVAGGLIGIMGNAEKLLPLREYAEYSIRGGSEIKGTEGLDSGYAFLWSQGITETLTLIVPDLFGGASPDYWGPKSTTSGPHYLGILALLFSVLALFKVRKNLFYLFFGTGILAILFAWGRHLNFFNQLAFDFIPFFSKFRAPETWLVLTAFCFSITTVYGFEWLLDYVKEKSISFKKLYAPLGTVTVIILAVFLVSNSLQYTKDAEINQVAVQIAQQNQVSPENPQVQQQARNYVNSRLVPDREEKATGDILRLALFTAIGIGLIYLMLTSKLSTALGTAAFILLLGIDMIGVDKRYMNERSFVAANIDDERSILSQKRDIDNYIQEHISENSTYPYRVFPLLDGAFSNNIPSFFYPSVGGYSGAKLSVYQDVFMVDGNPVFAGSMGLNLKLLELMNTKYLTYSRGLGLPGLTPAFQGQSGVVYELNNVLPKAFFVDSVITTADPVEAYNYLFPGQLNFEEIAVVEARGVSAQPDSVASVEIINYTGPELTIRTSRSVPGFLVLSEIYYPKGWTAILDGEQEIPIYKTNYLLRGMEVPAGEHTIELDFRPDSYSLGLTLSWISLTLQIGIALLAGFVYFRKKDGGES